MTKESFIRSFIARVRSGLVALPLVALPLVALPLVAGAPAQAVLPAGAARPLASAERADAGTGLRWATCGRDLPGFQCAVATVPLDYDQPGGVSIGIALTRLPATDQAHRIGSVFVNPGGPGGSGVLVVQYGFGEYLEQQLAGRFDVVGFDPRGIGASAELQCFASSGAEDSYLGSLPIFPYQPAQERPFFRTLSGLNQRCHARPGIAANMSTADVARDLDRLRAAVGDAQLTYLGFSYGTYIGNTYANLFPGRVRALVIDGVLDPRLWSSGRQVESDRIATQQEFDQFLAECDAAAATCSFHAPGGAAARWEQLATVLHQHPVTLADGSEYTYDYLIQDATIAMYSPEGWRFFADFFDSVADIALAGAPALVTAANRDALLARFSAPRAQYVQGVDGYFGNQCADTQYPSTLNEFSRIGRYARAGSRFGPDWWWFNAGCATWPVSADRYTGPWTARTSSPVLVVGNYYDGVTGYTGAQASARLLPNSQLLSYAGWGHTAYSRSDCVTGYVNGYLLTGALPAKGTLCPANPNPFLPPASASGASPSAALPMIGLSPPWPMRG